MGLALGETSAGRQGLARLGARLWPELARLVTIVGKVRSGRPSVRAHSFLGPSSSGLLVFDLLLLVLLAPFGTKCFRPITLLTAAIRSSSAASSDDTLSI